MDDWRIRSSYPRQTSYEYDQEITDKQLFAIKVIESNLPGIRFRGTRKWQASQFIGQYMEESKLAAEAKKVSRQMKEGNSVSYSNAVALRMYGKKFVGPGYDSYNLHMPDMRLAYIPEERE